MRVIINGEFVRKRSTRRYIPLCLLFALALVATRAGAQAKYTFTTFSVPNSEGTAVNAISESGDVAGFYFLPAPPPSPPLSYAGFLRTASGAITTISYPGADDTSAGGMNKFGVIVGTYTIGAGYGGFFCHNGTYKNAIVNDHPASLTGINDSGDYAGTYNNPFTGFVASPSGQVAILDDPNGYAPYSTTPVRIKNSGEVIGVYYDRSGNAQTFVWNAKAGYGTIFIPAVPGARVADFNASGTMVGTYVNGVTNLGFVYRNGQFEIVEPPGASASYITAINNKGQVAGYCNFPGTYSVGFIATPAP